MFRHRPTYRLLRSATAVAYGTGKRMKHFIRFPQLTTIALSYIAAALLFIFLGQDFFENLILPLGLAGVFVAGALYTYSFTASLGAVLLIALAPDYPAGVMAVVGGIGAMLADVAFFKAIGNALEKEVAKLGKSKLVCEIGATRLFCKKWFRDIIGFLVLCSPLPDEIGIGLMASAKMNTGTFWLVALIADMLGIYLLVTATLALS